MGALPLVAALLNKAKSLAEKLRSRTSYAKGTGYSKLYHAQVVDITRLSRGQSCTNLILMIQAHQDNTNHKGWTPLLSLEDWALLCRCDTKEVQRNRDHLTNSGMASVNVEMPKKGKGRGATVALYSFILHPEKWQTIPDYAPPAGKSQTDAPEETAADDDPDAPVKPGQWRMSKPQELRAGKPSKPVKPNVGMNSLQVVLEGVDGKWFTLVQGGVVKVTVTPSLDMGVEKAKVEGSKRVTNDPKDMHVPRTHKRGERTKGEDFSHPRSAELVALFDPILADNAARLLSGDFPSLKKACEAVQDCDHDYLVKFAVQRAERPVKGPAIVATICSEAMASWKASTRKGAVQKLPTMAEIDAIIVKEREDRAARRKARV